MNPHSINTNTSQESGPVLRFDIIAGLTGGGGGSSESYGIRDGCRACFLTPARPSNVTKHCKRRLARRSDGNMINQRAASPWNNLIGGQIELGKHFNIVIEGGVGSRSSILPAATFRL